MAQFKTFDIRSATVRAQGSAVAAQFYWEDLYRAAEQELPEDAHRAFRNAVERQIWERFEFKEIVNLPLFADLPEELRLRVCLPFPCFAERVRLKEIDTLFTQGAPCKSLGYLLVRGKLKLIRKDVGAKSTSAPDLIGIFPNKGEKGKEWSATAMADGEADILRFSWDHYSNQLVKRLSRDEQVAFMTSIKKKKSKALKTHWRGSEFCLYAKRATDSIYVVDGYAFGLCAREERCNTCDHSFMNS